MSSDKWEGGRHLKGVGAIRFSSHSKDANEDCTLSALVDAIEWIRENREHVAPLRIEFEQWDDDRLIKALTASEKLLRQIFPTEDEYTVWYATATVYYDSLSREQEASSDGTGT